MNETNVENNQSNDSKKIITLVILILTIMVCTTSATYAYFAITSPTNNSMTGTAATAGLIITDTNGKENVAPQLIAPTKSTYTSKPMVPQKSYENSKNILQLALNGATGKDKCVDSNDNAICRAYTFFIKNTSSAAINVRGSITFQNISTTNSASSNYFPNLYWKLMDSATTVTVSSAASTKQEAFSTTAPIHASTSQVFFNTSNLYLSPGASQQYWLITWIEETSTSQADKGTFNISLKFDAYQGDSSIGGITSTITG